MAGEDPHRPRPPQEDVENSFLTKQPFPKLLPNQINPTAAYSTTFIGSHPISLNSVGNSPSLSPPPEEVENKIQFPNCSKSFINVLKNNSRVVISPKPIVDTLHYGICQRPIHLKPTTTFHGKPSVLFSKSDKERFINNLKFVLIGKFSRGRPTMGTVKMFFSNLKLKGEYNISVFDPKHLIIECQSFEDFVRIWVKLVWVVGGFSMRVFKWREDFNPSKESSVCPIWVHLPGLPLFLFDEQALYSLAYAIGTPLKIDWNNLNRSKLGSASFCVEIDVAATVPDKIWIDFVDEKSVEGRDGFWQKVVYNSMPPFCLSCAHLGHSLDACKRRNGRCEEHVGDGTLQLVPVANDGDVLLQTAFEKLKGCLINEAKDMGLGQVCAVHGCADQVRASQGCAVQGFAVQMSADDERQKQDLVQVHGSKGMRQVEGMLVNDFVQAEMVEDSVGKDEATKGVFNLMQVIDTQPVKHSLHNPLLQDTTKLGTSETNANELNVVTVVSAAASPAHAAVDSAINPVSATYAVESANGEANTGVLTIGTIFTDHLQGLKGEPAGHQVFPDRNQLVKSLAKTAKLGAITDRGKIKLAAEFETGYISANNVADTNFELEDAQGTILELTCTAANDGIAARQIAGSVEQGNYAYGLADAVTEELVKEGKSGTSVAGHLQKADLVQAPLSRLDFAARKTATAGQNSAGMESGTESVKGAVVTDVNEGMVSEREEEHAVVITEEENSLCHVEAERENSGGTLETDAGDCAGALVEKAHSWADLVEEEHEQQLAREHNAILEWDVTQLNAFVQKQIEEIKHEIGQTEAKIRETANEEKKEEQIRIVSQLSLTEVEDFAKKEIEKIWATPTKVTRVFDTTRPIISNPYIRDKEGSPVLCSEIFGKSKRLSHLRNVAVLLKTEENLAVLVERGTYDGLMKDLMEVYSKGIHQTIEEHQHTIFSKEG